MHGRSPYTMMVSPNEGEERQGYGQITVKLAANIIPKVLGT